MSTEINQGNNFCQIFELPKKWPTDFCFNGGNKCQILQVDWFNPIPVDDLPEFGGTLKPWSEYVNSLVEFVKAKPYIRSGYQYLILTNFGKCEVFTGK